jgi:hypothetical protein
LKGNTLATRRMPQGSYSPAWGTGHEGRGLRTTATGTGYAAGFGTGPGAATGKIGADPWVNTLNPLGATYNIAPSYLPSPLTVIVSPFVHYQQGGASISTGTPAVTRAYPTTSVIMCQSDACGILVQRTPVGVEEWDNPERDIRNMKIRESWGMQLLEQGKGVTIARYVVIARNYVFDNTNAVTLGEHDHTTAISSITG